MKFNIGAVSPKTYKHRYNSFNVTTCNPIFVQPTFFRVVMPNSKINCTFKQTLRTLPMPFPSFANVKICNKAFFVPIEDICDNFANLMSEKPYSTDTGSYVPKNLPFVSCTILTDNIIKNPNLSSSKYFKNIVGPEPVFPSSSSPSKSVASSNFDYNTRFAPLFDNVDIETFAPSDNLSISKFLEIRNQFIVDGVDYFDTERVQAILDHKRGVSPSSSPSRAAANADEQHQITELDGYDYVNVYNTSDASDTVHDAQGILLSAQGAAVVKILNGLGYKFTRSDDTTVNLMPLIAFYKCWFESFYPSRLEDFQETVAGKLIKKFQENKIDFTKWNDPQYSTILYEFLDSLGKCFISNPTDFASMHMASLNNGQSTDDSNLSFDPSFSSPYSSDYHITSTNTTSKVAAIDTSQGEFTAYDIKLLLWLQKYVNRDSIIGNRIDLWMRSHLNSDVYSRLVARSRVLGYSEFAVNIGDVDSTAQTSDLTANQGAPLGAYAGKAVGSGEFKFKGSFNTYGFVIVLSWYECSTDVTQCVDPQLFATNKWTIPQPELDCMGYEVTPQSAFYTDNGICAKGMLKFQSDYATNHKGFGFVPRLSGFKTFRPVVNGDLARRSMINSYLPFVNRRYLNNNSFYVGKTTVLLRANKVPIASARWRWQNAEPVIGGYDNIFAYNNWSGFYHQDNFYDTSLPKEAYIDNIILYTSIDLMEVNPLKPLSNSYDTDILKDDGELTVNNN